jgi:hypothetical protein
VPVWRGIQYTEFVSKGRAESPRGSFATDNVQATRVLEVDWANLYPFARSVVGYPVLRSFLDGGSGNLVRYVSRVTPMPYSALLRSPDSFGTLGPFMYATDILEWHGVGQYSIDLATGTATYPRARLTVVYSTLTYDVAEDALCVPPAGPLAALNKPDEGYYLTRHFTRFWRPAQRVDFVPFGAMITVDDVTAANRLPVRRGIPFYVPLADVTYVQHACPYVPSKAIQAAVNKINATAFDNDRFPAETLLCLTPDIQPYFSPIGDRLYNLVWRFKWQPNVDAGGTPRGWNYFHWKKPGVTPATIDYAPVSTTGLSTGTKMYRTTEFRDLLRPDWN